MEEDGFFNINITLREYLDLIDIPLNDERGFTIYERNYPHTPFDISRKCLETTNMKSLLHKNIYHIDYGFDDDGFEGCRIILM